MLIWIFLIIALIIILVFTTKESFVNWYVADPFNRLTDDYKAIADYSMLKRRGMHYYPIWEAINVYNSRHGIQRNGYGTRSSIVGYARRTDTRGDRVIYKIVYDYFRDKHYADNQNGFVTEIKSPQLRRGLELPKNSITITGGLLNGKYSFQLDDNFYY